MKNRRIGAAIALALGLMLSTTAGPAKAVFLTGNFSINGTNTYDTAANTITFYNTPFIAVGTGSFAGLLGSPLTVEGQGTIASALAVDYSALAGVFLFTGGGLQFVVSSADFEETANNQLTIDAVGTLSLTGFDPTPGTFSLSTQGVPAATTVSFSATVVAVPGPIVGAGLPGILLACGALVAFARRRRLIKV